MLSVCRDTQAQPQNIMYDKRVVRGSNYSQAHLVSIRHITAEIMNRFTNS